MTVQEAIKKIRDNICQGKGSEMFCRDVCMYGENKCAYEMAIEALEKMAGIERALERLEEEGKLADEEKERCARKAQLQFDRAVGYANGIFNAIKTIKEELHGTASAELAQPKWKENMLQKFMRSE